MRNVQFYRARMDRRLGIKDLAAIIGRAPSVVSQIANGKKKPTKKQALELARILEVDVEVLFPDGFSPYQEPPARPTKLELGEHYWIKVRSEDEDWQIARYDKAWNQPKFFQCCIMSHGISKVYAVGPRVERYTGPGGDDGVQG